MKLLFFFTFFLFSFLIGNGQVPAPSPGVPPQGAPFQVPPQGIFPNIANPNDPLERVRLRDHDTNMILDMIQRITERYILRPQNLPQVKITFDSMDVLSKRDTLLALQSLLAMNGVGITKIDSQFYKAVPAKWNECTRAHLAGCTCIFSSAKPEFILQSILSGVYSC